MVWEEKSVYSFALVGLCRARVFSLSLVLLFAPGVKGDPRGVLIAAEAVGLTHIASARLPLNFEPNLGQADPRAKFLARGRGYTLFLTKDEAVLVLEKPEVRSQESEVRRGKTSVVRSPWSVAQ
jgi:hypothetical protein